MKQRDRLTYDLEPHQARSAAGPSRGMLALLIVIALVAVLLVVLMLRSYSTPDATDRPGDVQTSGQPATSPSPAATASSAPAFAGSDADEQEAAPEGSQQAAEEFVAAWLERDSDARKPALEAIAAPGLAEQLMLTSSENIPDTDPSGEPVLVEASTYSVEFEQTLADDSKIKIYLVADPEAERGWLATSVEQV